MILPVFDPRRETRLGFDLRRALLAEVNLAATPVAPLGLDGFRTDRRQFLSDLLIQRQFVFHENSIAPGLYVVKG